MKIYFAKGKNLLTKDLDTRLIWAYFNAEQSVSNFLIAHQEQIFKLKITYQDIEYEVDAFSRQDVKQLFVYDKEYWILFALDMMITNPNIITALLFGEIYILIK